MCVWKVLACIGMLGALLLFAFSMQWNAIYLIGSAVGAANFSMLALIVDRLPPKKD